MRGYVTDIQRFSLKDGPGIRTTVFLQNCNMRCAWCHNPETISPVPQLLNYKENCIGCGHCINVCPSGALSLKDTGIHINRMLCNQCGSCVKECFSGALLLSSVEMSVEAVMDELLQDEAYYRNSNGGVTLSGGEVFMQTDFALELLTECRRKQISTAIESNLNVEWAQIEQMLPVLDLLMCDIKMMDPQKHLRWTGTDNRNILDNITRLSQFNIPIVIRTPVIPGVNDKPADVEEIASYIKTANIPLLYYELLRFNPLGDAKYRGLDRLNAFKGREIPTDEEMKCLQEAASRYAITVRID